MNAQNFEHVFKKFSANTGVNAILLFMRDQLPLIC